MAHPACSICAQLSPPNLPPVYNEKTEKEVAPQRYDCCGRFACPSCISKTPRFRSYCPYCQQSTYGTSQDQKLTKTLDHGLLQGLHGMYPEVNELDQQSKDLEKVESNAPDVLHFVDPSDTISTLAIRYGVPAVALRRTNGLYSDHLLAARRTILIPGEYYKAGISLSPRPIEGEEEEARKRKLHKFQTICKVPEYDVALLYLDQANYDLDEAIHVFQEDEAWEKRNPLSKGKNARASIRPRR